MARHLHYAGWAALGLDLGTYPDCCMAYGLYELDTARLIKRLLRVGDHFVDAGANIGYFTLLGRGSSARAGAWTRLSRIRRIVRA